VIGYLWLLASLVFHTARLWHPLGQVRLSARMAASPERPATIRPLGARTTAVTCAPPAAGHPAGRPLTAHRV
jgi:hypothetical protein